MAVEVLGNVFQNGYTWLLDHDDTAGTVGITVTDDGNPEQGTLVVSVNVWQPPTPTLLGTFSSPNVVPFDNQGRQVLIQNNALKNMSLLPLPHQPPTGIYVESFGSFTPGASARH